jgi:hypothetical protein
MKTFFRSVLLLSIVGACYMLGRWQATRPPTEIQTSLPAHPKGSATSKAGAAPAPVYFTTVDEVRALFADPNRSSDDKQMYFDEALLPGVNPADLPAIIKLITDLPPSIMEWFDKKFLLGDLLNRLGAADPVAMFSLIDNYPDLDQRTYIVSTALGKLAESDPQQALNMLAQLSSGDVNTPMDYSAIFGGWATEHVTDAMSAALSLPTGPNRSAALEAVGAALMNPDPAAALRWAQGLPPSDANVLNGLVQNVLVTDAQYGNFDQSTAASYLNLVSDLSIRNNIIHQMASYLDANPTAAVDWLNQVATGVTYDNAINEIFSFFNNPTPFVGVLDKVTEPGARAGAIDALASRWSQINSSDALAWAQTLPDADATARAGALNTILTSLAKSNPAAAAEFVENSDDPADFLPATPAIAKTLAATDLQGALDLTDSLPDGTTKDQALGNVLTTWSQSDFTSAWNYAASLPDDGERGTVMVSLVNSTAQKDPAQAVSLIEQIPAGPTQLNAISSVAATWVKQDPQAFTTWLGTLPASDARDTAISQLVSSTQAAKNPAGVLAWVNTVANPATKAALLQQLTPAPASTPK